VAELARVVKEDGVVCILTPNEPADFENPFHLHLFGRDELRAMLERHFDDVWLGGVDAAPHVKADFAARRIKANKLLRLDVLDICATASRTAGTCGPTPGCCRWPTSWWPGATPGGDGHHGRRLVRHRELDDTTLVLLAVARPRPNQAA
jgi:SAM-dependent methyltransferase